MEIGSIVISITALVISAYTAWRTLLQKGTLKMTKPTVIYFGPDAGDSSPKVFIRSLLYSTSKNGRIIESMYVKIRRGETSQNFNIWVCGDDKLLRGSGLFVGENGVSFNHHFLLPKDGTNFDFFAGEYVVEIYSNLVGDSKPLLLATEKLHINELHSLSMNKNNTGIYFDWGPDSRKYHAHVDEKEIFK